MNRLLTLGTASFVAIGSLACSGTDDQPIRREIASDAGSGNGNGSAGTPTAGTAAGSTGGVEVTSTQQPPAGCGSVLPVTIRDFKGGGEAGGHTDFEISARMAYDVNGQLYKGYNDAGCGMVEAMLGADSKPIFYAGPPEVAYDGATSLTGIGRQKRLVSGPGCWKDMNTMPTGVCNIGSCVGWDYQLPTYEIESTTTFNQWYNTIEGVNMEIAKELPLTDDGTGVYIYDTNAFFPIDGEGFGNTPGWDHNYHFTSEAHVKFTYQQGQVFTFRGDDDLWIFVNSKLALDVGGLHQALQGTINFDAQAADLGITPGAQYQMDIFHAERQTDQSNFRIETNISCFEPVDIIK